MTAPQGLHGLVTERRAAHQVRTSGIYGVGLCDTCGGVWPCPDSEGWDRVGELVDAADELLRVAFRDEDFLTQNGIPMAGTPGVRRALRKYRSALGPRP